MRQKVTFQKKKSETKSLIIAISWQISCVAKQTLKSSTVHITLRHKTFVTRE